MRRILISFILTLSAAFADSWSLQSPDGTVVGVFRFDDQGLHLQATYDDQPIFADSRFQFEGKGIAFPSAATELIEVTRRTGDETWQPLWGRFDEVRDQHQFMLLKLRDGARSFHLEVRAYNDAIAFRTIWPGDKPLALKRERIELRYQNPVRHWGNGDFARSWMVERFTTQLGNGLHAAFLEADIQNYPAMHMTEQGDQLIGTHKGAIKIKPGSSTPWRVLLLARDPGALITSTTILNLNPPSRIDDTSWVQPGISLWDWRLRGASGADGFTYAMDELSFKRLIDFAAENNLPYVMIDAHWYGDERKGNPNKPHDIDLPGLIQYAKEKDVGFWVYVNATALRKHGVDQVLRQYKEWGAVGIKLGFLNGTSQGHVDFFNKVIETTAELKLMLNCHECIPPSGRRRTWPHMLTREYNRSLMDGGTQKASSPESILIWPFTNMLGGPLDRTPGMFTLKNAHERDFIRSPMETTVLSQAAQCVIFFTGLLCLPDHDEAYRAKPELFDFIRSIPCDWDETRVLNAAIGDRLTIARRSGDRWYVASLTDEQPRSLEIPLDFLGAGSYEATIFTDHGEGSYLERSEHFEVEKIQVDQSQTIIAKLAPGSGHCIFITR